MALRIRTDGRVLCAMPSSRVKILPWYYTDRDAPTRAVSDAEAIASDWAAVGMDLQRALDSVIAETIDVPR